MLRLLDVIPLFAAMALAATLGLAPFAPEPHVWEKLKLLAAGGLTRPVDMFDLALHGAPWLLVVAKLARRPRA
ncbi:MAG: RND transporter [Pseudomonadota bacterium]|nr:RND transporter [Pseudomonadota bacterium]